MVLSPPESIREFIESEIAYLSENVKATQVILEVGCGYGRLLEIIGGNANLAVGLDFSWSLLKRAKSDLANIQSVLLALALAQQIPFKDGSFNCALCVNATFGNMPGLELAVLAEMKRTLKPGGKIILSVFSENAREAQIENYQRLGLKIEKEDSISIQTREGLFSRRFSKNDLRKLFERIGLACEITRLCPISYLATAIRN